MHMFVETNPSPCPAFSSESLEELHLNKVLTVIVCVDAEGVTGGQGWDSFLHL